MERGRSEDEKISTAIGHAFKAVYSDESPQKDLVGIFEWIRFDGKASTIDFLHGGRDSWNLRDTRKQFIVPRPLPYARGPWEMRDLVREPKVHEIFTVNAIRRFQLQWGLLGCEGKVPDLNVERF